MKKKGESGSMSPDRAYDEKKMKSSRRIFDSYSGDCNLITFLSFLRSLSIW
jgi:hypothetical protein